MIKGANTFCALACRCVLYQGCRCIISFHTTQPYARGDFYISVLEMRKPRQRVLSNLVSPLGVELRDSGLCDFCNLDQLGGCGQNPHVPGLLFH